MSLCFSAGTPSICSLKQPSRSARMQQGRQSRWSMLLVGLCVLLVLIFGTVQAAHTHDLSADGFDSHADCSLCLVSHASAQITPAPVVHLESVLLERLVAGTARPAFTAPLHFDLSSRPPPVVSTLAA